MFDKFFIRYEYLIFILNKYKKTIFTHHVLYLWIIDVFLSAYDIIPFIPYFVCAPVLLSSYTEREKINLP